ncbi:MAG: Ig-like domain-containing protein [Candidatus Zixiibacteriota bacterium]
MNRALRFLMMGLLVFSVPISASAINLVEVESKDVAPGTDSVRVGVFVTNDFDVVAFVLPLEFRSVTPGTFTRTLFRFNVPATNRVGSSPLTGSSTKQTYPTPTTPECSGPVSSTYNTGGSVDFVSPDGAMWTGVSTSAPPNLWYLPAGSDSVAGVHRDWPQEGDSTVYAAGASFNFLFHVTSTPGWFEIDTCCVLPANNLSFVDVNTNLVTPDFIRGLIKVGDATAPPVVSDIPDQTIAEGQSFVTIPLDDYVSDFDHADDQLTWTATGQSQLNVSISPARIATISTPGPEWSGAETITFTARDPDNLTGSDPATFAVTPVNDPPVLTPIGPMSVQSGYSLIFSVKGTDVDNAALTLSMVNAPPTATLSQDGSGNGQFFWLTACLDSGAHNVTFIVSDGELADSEVVVITVQPNPDRFQANPDSLAFHFAVGVNEPPPDTTVVTDPGCGELSWTATTTESWLLIDPTAGTTPKGIVVSIDTTGLVAGSYDAKITITQSTDLKLAPVQIEVPVHLDVETEVCDCPCQGDPIPFCDGITDIRDVVQIIYVVFRGYLDVGYSTCPVSVNDVNCDCQADVADVVTAIERVFRYGAPFCDPCVVRPPCPPRMATAH